VVNIARLILLLVFAWPTGATAAADCMPHVGERMEFAVGWEFINAGSAVMKVSSPRENVYRISTFARSNAFFDLFKKVRDEIIAEGVCNNGRMQSTLFELKQHEVKYHASKKTEFVWPEGKVRYTQNNRTDIYEVKHGELDVMDAFFAVRSMPLEKDKVLKIPVFDSRKNYEIEVRVLKKEILKAPWHEFVECLVIEPKLKTAGIFSSKGKMKVWLTNDTRRIPLKMVAKIRFGHIIARLTGYKKD